MKLPTQLAARLLSDHIKVRCIRPIETQDAIATFQKMAIVGEPIETCIQALNVWLDITKQINLDRLPSGTPEKAALLTVHTLSKKDILGEAISAITAIMDAPTGAMKDKLAAAAIINELYGDKELIKDEVLTDKLMINLVGKD